METLSSSTTGTAFLLKEHVRLLRVEQYVKNLFILLPLFFSLHIGDLELLFRATVAFVAFSMAASSVYIFNDYLDAEEDRRHPVKRNRPLAAGTVTRKSAALLILVLAVPALTLSGLLSTVMLNLVFLYLVMNVAYAWKLKHIPIIDIGIIAAGFVVRVLVGGSVTGTTIYMWIIIMTFLLALFLALAKRRDDVLLFIGQERTSRRAIDGYNLVFIDSAMVIMAAVTIVAYIMYTVSPDVMVKFRTDKLYITTLFVVLGILRYMQITFVENKSGSPTEILLRDGFLQCVILSWLATFAFLIYA
ncbi:MAG TPA: decaprenyl-phosphate phosphoribosyltransferase [Syntrophales bacterium]|nr:decaprenyl-phosphate phosphoribosyltransferase [Syntrophales bacterium]